MSKFRVRKLWKKLRLDLDILKHDEVKQMSNKAETLLQAQTLLQDAGEMIKELKEENKEIKQKLQVDEIPADATINDAADGGIGNKNIPLIRKSLRDWVAKTVALANSADVSAVNIEAMKNEAKIMRDVEAFYKSLGLDTAKWAIPSEREKIDAGYSTMLDLIEKGIIKADDHPEVSKWQQHLASERPSRVKKLMSAAGIKEQESVKRNYSAYMSDNTDEDLFIELCKKAELKGEVEEDGSTN